MLSVIMLNDAMLNVIMLFCSVSLMRSVTYKLFYAKCHDAEYHYAMCHGTSFSYI
jgi:hypothetical protein